MLKLPDYSKPFRIDLAADASDVAVGAELSQNGQPVAFYIISLPLLKPGTMSLTESCWPSIKPV